MNSDKTHLDSFEFKRRSKCRACDGPLESLWDLGDFALTGIFPNPGAEVPIATLEVTHCTTCSLVQLAHDYTMETFFGKGYGYRSGLNASMVAHLATIAQDVSRYIKLNPGDTVLDVGGNDGTNLANFSSELHRIIVDPTAKNWDEFIPHGIEVIPTFFDKKIVEEFRGVKLLMSISMLYDLPDPRRFIQDVYDVLMIDGLWVTEQSDLDLMFQSNAFDTICHEHLEYYSRDVLVDLAADIGFQLIHESKNKANGGSTRIIFRKVKRPEGQPKNQIMTEILERQRKSFRLLASYSENLKFALEDFIKKDNCVAGLGASTKGNTLLQLMNLSQENIIHIAEVNPDKYGLVTPGTNIPIVSEEHSRQSGATHYIVLPWHFEKTFLKKRDYFGYAKLIFPMPKLKVI